MSNDWHELGARVGSPGRWAARGFGPFVLRVVGSGPPRVPWVAGPGPLDWACQGLRWRMKEVIMTIAAGSEDPAARHKAAEVGF